MKGILRCVALAALIACTGAAAVEAQAAADQPNWHLFPAYPPLDGADSTGNPSDPDPRRFYCHPAGPAAAGPCEIDLRRSAEANPAAWDQVPAALPSLTTTGNNTDAALAEASPLTPGPDRSFRPTSPTRDYFWPWTDQWRNTRCNPANFAGATTSSGGTDANDVNAAIVNLFGTLNRLHDWSYELGFGEAASNFQVDNLGKGGEEGDPVLGDAQAAPLDEQGDAAYLDAPAATPDDGTPPLVLTHLWQPVAAVSYGPCVDGSFDVSLIAQRFARAAVDRMIGGPDAGVVETSGIDGQAAALREGFADVIAAAFVRETAGVDGFAIGPYVSGNAMRGLRAYAMDASPLNYSNLRGWDGTGGGSASDDGEVWAATLDEVRRRLVAEHGPSGSSRFVGLVFDSLAGLPPDATMTEARDGLLRQATAADRKPIWRAFARRGLGQRAAGPVGSGQPRPSFETPREANEATVKFVLRAVDEGGRPLKGRVYVGQYEAGTTPVADTIRSTNTSATARFVPGTYAFAFQAAGYGLVRTTLTLASRQNRVLTVSMPANRASRTKGATARGSGAGLSALIDDTEATNWTVTASGPVDESSLEVTINLSGTRPARVDRIGVSAALGGDENRFTALRSFTLLRCVATAARKCTKPAHFRPLGGEREPFAAGVPWPTARDLALRSINVSNRRATHLRLVVNGNQCTDGEAYRGALENDPDHEADCVLGAPEVAQTVRAAELQVFSGPPSVRNSAAP